VEAKRDNSKEGYLAVIESRRLTYAFLSRMYEKEMTEDLLKELSKENSLTLQFGGSEDPGKGFLDGFEMLSGYLKRLRERDLDQVRLELAMEYADLFLGLKGKPPHPSESVYRSKAHIMFQGPRDEVLSTYWKAGVDTVKEFKEPEDHIAIELQFMEYLCRKTREALERNEVQEAGKLLQAQEKFIDDHLAKWVPQFTKDVEETATTDFYKGVAYITDAFIASDRRAISDMMGKGGLFA
jgi:TorA maturation chaperone TorD